MPQGRSCLSEDAPGVDGIIEAMACDARSTTFLRLPSQAPQVAAPGGARGAALKRGFESLNGDVVIFTNDVDRQQDSTIGLNPTVYDSDHRVHRDL